LLLGARAPDLAGVDHDIELMQAALAHLGFAPQHIDTVLPATRADILAAMQRLIAATQPDDAVVLYYSGHGAKLDSSTRAMIGETAYHQFLVPSDFEQSTEDDFRGYTNAELSLDLDALTRKSKNVIVIMDCCHAGRVLRSGPGEQQQLKWQDTSKYPAVRHLDVVGRWAASAARHYEKLREARQLELDKRDAEANPWAVRLLASASGGKAYEVECPPSEGSTHRFAGTMTFALHQALMGIDPACTTWQDVGRMIRQTPQRRGGQQRVTIEGPCRRLLFSLSEREQLGELDLELGHGRILITGGRLAGLVEGDRYELRTLTDRGVDAPLGEAIITVVESSYAEVHTSVKLESLRPGSSARPLRYARARAAVELVGVPPTSKQHELLAARVGASGFLRVVEPGADDDALPVVATLRFENERLQLWCEGVGFDQPRAFDPARSPTAAERLAEHMTQSLHRLARAVCLRSLTGVAGQLAPTWELTWALVEDGRLGRTLERGNEQLAAGERFTVWLRSSQPLWLTAFAVGPDARIELLTRAQPGGVEIEPGSAGYLLSQRSGETPTNLRGIEVSRSSSLVLILSDTAVDLRSWEQPGLSRFVARDVLDPEPSSRNLSAPVPSIRPARYHVETWSF
jgi:hypothetical protein